MKMKKSTKVFFWLTVVFLLTGAFLLWSLRGAGLRMATGGWMGYNPQYLLAIGAVGLSAVFAFLSFVRFIRSKSVAGGLFFTMIVSTALFFAANAFLITPASASNAANITGVAGVAGTVGAVTPTPTLSPLVGLAQIGLFAIWFVILLISVYAHVRPVKRIERALTEMINNPENTKLKVGKGKQFASIEGKLNIIAKRLNQDKLLAQIAQQKREQLRIKRETQKPRQGEIIVA